MNKPSLLKITIKKIGKLAVNRVYPSFNRLPYNLYFFKLKVQTKFMQLNVSVK